MAACRSPSPRRRDSRSRSRGRGGGGGGGGGRSPRARSPVRVSVLSSLSRFSGRHLVSYGNRSWNGQEVLHAPVATCLMLSVSRASAAPRILKLQPRALTQRRRAGTEPQPQPLRPPAARPRMAGGRARAGRDVAYCRPPLRGCTVRLGCAVCLGGLALLGSYPFPPSPSLPCRACPPRLGVPAAVRGLFVWMRRRRCWGRGGGS